jgi:hypothetical protein
MPPLKVVYATANCATATTDGVPVMLHEGEVWDALDNLVIARPGLFSDTPPAPNFPRRTVRAVEQATSAPGELRNVRRG